MTGHKRWFRVQAIGTVYREDSAGPEQFLDPGKPSIIRIDPRWEAGLAGIEKFSHLVVLFYPDRAERRRVPESRCVPKVAPTRQRLASSRSYSAAAESDRYCLSAIDPV